MTLTLMILGHDFVYEMECTARIFFAKAKIIIVKDNSFTASKGVHSAESSPALRDCELRLVTMAERVDLDTIRLTVLAAIKPGEEFHETREIPAGDDGLTERVLAAMMFKLLSKHTGKRPPWGILTGIRPVRLCEQWSGQGLSGVEIKNRLMEEYLVLSEKAGLCLEIGGAQKHILSLNKPDTFSLYVSIPFCPTRCLYCSFVSHAIDRAAKLVPDYVRLLCEELKHISRYAAQKNLRLLSVYVGGGTPTSLEAADIKRILETIGGCFDLSQLLEYTVEAGRPDTITAEKLEVLRLFGVDRISVNPQSMNDNVLKAIGRSHTAEQTAESILLVKSFGFKSINMDLIAGLPEETTDSFAESLDKVLCFTPDNLTVHTLTVKRASHLREETDAFPRKPTTASEMLCCAEKRIRADGYLPYYLYRQKATVENLENVGYSKPGHEGIYNIFSMDDRHNILAAGAGGVSKMIEDDEIKRVFNYKYPFEYISRFDEMILKKKGGLI